MIKFLLSKDGIYLGIILIMVLSAWYILDDWHYKPLRVADNTIEMLGNQLNECINVKVICEANLSKQTVEGYQDGLGEGNEDFNFDLDNLTSS